MKTIRILVADDHAVVRRGLRHILATTPDLAIAAEAGNGAEVLEKLRSGQFDVVLMDISMPGTDAVELIGQVKKEHPQVSVLVHSMHAESPVASRMLKASSTQRYRNSVQNGSSSNGHSRSLAAEPMPSGASTSGGQFVAQEHDVAERASMISTEPRA